MEEILARAKKVAEEAEVYTTSITETPVQFEANRLKHLQTRQSQTIALRIIKNGKFGYATTTQPDRYQELVDNAVATAEFGTVAEFHFPGFTSFPEVEVFDPAVEKVTFKEMAALGQEIVDALTKNTPGLLCEGGVTKMVAEMNIANSNGGQCSYRETVFGLGMEGQLVRGTDMLFVGDSDTSCHPILDASMIIKTVTRQLELARLQATVAGKQMPVLFTPDGVASALVLPLMSAFNGKTVLEGASPLGDKSGKLVFDEGLTMTDDPLVPYRPGSCPCDDEGVPSQRTPLITKGVVSSFLYDLQTAARAKTRSTGNGRRQGGLPSPSLHAFVLETGKRSFDDMVKGIDEGLVVEQLMGASQGNVLGGDFSGNVLLGYRIEKGKIVGRVKDTVVSGNVYQLLKQVTIGNDSKWVSGSLCTPSLLFENVSVAGR